jgi:hypothetical protein
MSTPRYTDVMTQTPDLTPVASTEANPEFGHMTVWIDFPNAGVDRPRTYGIGVTKRNLPRLVAAVNAGKVATNPEIRTDVGGNTYVAFTSAVHGRTVNVDLKRLGY